MFDVNIDEVEVTLSFMRWLDGKGLVKDAKVKGVRGVVGASFAFLLDVAESSRPEDRRSVWWDVSKPLSPADWRHSTLPGDFELESMSIEDALMTIYQPGGQRPYNVSVFSALIGPLRKRWLFYDLMSAEGITGQFDNCLFSLHMPQKLGKTKTGEGDVVKRMVCPVALFPHECAYTHPGSLPGRRATHRARTICDWSHCPYIMDHIREAGRRTRHQIPASPR